MIHRLFLFLPCCPDKRVLFASFVLAFFLCAPPAPAHATDAQDFVNSQGNLEFQVNGTRSVQMANPSTTCNSANEGAIYYDSTTSHALKVCNGTAWISATASSSGLASCRVCNYTYDASDTLTWICSAYSSANGFQTAMGAGAYVFAIAIQCQ